MKSQFLYAALLGMTLISTGGCSDNHSTAPDAPAQPTDGGVDVDVHADSAPSDRQEARRERREERRENLREKIDDVDVDVDRGGVDVNVD